MNPQWQYNPLAIPLGLSLIIILILIGLGLRQRHNPIIVPYLFFMFSLFIWMLTSLLELLTLNLQLSLFYADISFVGITFLPVGWLWVVMIYNGKRRQFHRLLPLIILVPVLTNIIIWTNSLHGLWRGDSYRDLTTASFPISIYNYGPWFYNVHIPFSLGVVLIAMIMLVRSFVFQQKAYRTQILILIFALGLPVVVEILHQLGLDPIPHFTATPLVFPISGILVSWVLLRHRFLDLTPIARELVVESMEDLMLVLDDQGRVIDLNPSARRRLFADRKAVVGQKIEVLLPDVSQPISSDNSNYDEIEITQQGETRSYEVRLSYVTHPSGNKAGRLLLLHDITDRRRAEQVFYEQAQQVAVLEERQRLARELHDSVNQTLFAAGTLADLLPRAIEKKPEKVPEYAFNIRQLIHGTTAEMRLVLLELHPDALLKTDLGTIIKHLCDAYTGSTGTPVEFSSTAQVHLDEDAQIAFYRIAQEALHNIRKHADADTVTVQLRKSDDTLELVIADDGRGFDISDHPPGHFGLTNMVERAKSVGAVLYIISAINEGTTIKVVRTPS